MKKYGIEGCPAYEVFTDEASAHALLKSWVTLQLSLRPYRRQRCKVMGDQLPDLKAAREYTSELLEKALWLLRSAS